MLEKNKKNVLTAHADITKTAIDKALAIGVHREPTPGKKVLRVYMIVFPYAVTEPILQLV